jgi:ABC-type multidrug transport system fused ATPase/permease subunit
MIRPVRTVTDRARAWWTTLSFGARAPRRRLATLALLGLATGIGESAVVVLLVALASRGHGDRLPLIAMLPGSPWELAAIALLAAAGLALAHLGAAITAARAAADAARGVQTRLVRAFLGAPWPAQAAAPAGELQELVTVRTALIARGTEEATQAVAALLNLVVLLAVAGALSLWATVGLVAAVAVVLTFARGSRTRRRRWLRRARAANAALSTEMTETAAAARDLRVFGVGEPAAQRLATHIDAVASSSVTSRVMVAATGPLTRDATVGVLIVCLALVVSQTDVSLSGLGATVVLVLRALAHGQTLASVGVSMQEREDCVSEIEAHVAAWRPRTHGRRPCPPLDSIEFCDVSYTHAGADRPAVAGVTLRLVRGELLGVVGRTGAGKSTLAAIALGLLTPARGSVSVGGLALDEIDPAEWHSRTAWVGQDPHLLTGTVAENIRYLRDEIGDEAVHAAALAAGLAPELTNWPQGLEHHIGPAGAALSGGQRQRVALARALAGDPALLVLDEPTSALDPHAEAAVRDALTAASRDRIVVVIAHRPSTVRACDRIAVIEDGRIAACAPAERLAAGSAYFREVVALSNA